MGTRDHLSSPGSTVDAKTQPQLWAPQLHAPHMCICCRHRRSATICHLLTCGHLFVSLGLQQLHVPHICWPCDTIIVGGQHSCLEFHIIGAYVFATTDDIPNLWIWCSVCELLPADASTQLIAIYLPVEVFVCGHWLQF